MKRSCSRFIFCLFLFSGVIHPAISHSETFNETALTFNQNSTYKYFFTADGQMLMIDKGQDGSGLGYFDSPTTGLVTVGDFAGGGNDAWVSAVSDDFSTAVGSGVDATHYEGFVWTSGTGLVGTGVQAGYNHSQAVDVSSDGSVVAGHSLMNYFVRGWGTEAFIWESGVLTPLGFIAGGDYSETRAISDDGSVVVGIGNDGVGQSQAFRWTQATGMVGLGKLPGTSYTDPYGLSHNGKVIVGYNEYVGMGGEGFYWTQETGLVGVGFLAGSTLSAATAASDDAVNIFGYSFGAPGGGAAFRYRTNTGAVAISDILTDAGVDVSAYYIDNVTDTNRSGTLISGDATVLAGGNIYYWANLDTGGFITDSDLAASISSVELPIQATQKTVSQISQSLYAARLNSTWGHQYIRGLQKIDYSSPASISPAAGPVESPSRISGYVVGNLLYGQGNDLSNWGVNGTAGLKVALDDEWVVGLGINGAESKSKEGLDSVTELVSKGGSVLASYVGKSGLRFYTSLFYAGLTADVDRGYLNGADVDFSRGSTDGYAFGGAARLGWAFELDSDTNVTPYVELQAAKIHLNGYSETGGAFPLTFSDQTSITTIQKIGGEVEHQYSDDLKLNTQIAFVHTPDSRNSTSYATLDTFTFSLPEGDVGDQSWVEGSVGFEYDVTQDFGIAAELNGRTGNNVFPEVGVSVGMSYRF